MSRGPIYLDADIAAALRACDGNAARAARWLGCSLLTITNRTRRSKELARLRRKIKSGRPRLSYVAAQVVTDEQIIAALDGSDSVAGAARALGVERQVFLSRAYNPDVEAALTQCEQRWKAARLERQRVYLEERRAHIAERLAQKEEHDRILEEMRAEWHRVRDAWIADAGARGLTLREMGRILGITRERVRQVEEQLGIVPRAVRKRRAAA